MYLCLLDSPYLLHHFSILTWKHGFFCVALWVCCSNPTPWLECVHASVHVFMSTWLSMSSPPPMHSHMEKWVPLCGTVCVCCSHPTPWLECVYAHVHVFMLKWIPMSPQIPMHSLMKTWLPCMAQCMFPSHLISVPIPCLECVHASVHVFMSTQLPMLAQPPIHCYMETWISLCDSVCVCVCPSHPTIGPTPWLKCVHASVHVYMSTWLTMCASPFLNSYMETWVPLCSSVCVAVSLIVVPHLD